MNRNRIVLTLAVVAMATLAFTATSANAVIIGELGVLDDSANGGINPKTSAAWAPGDTYRLAFHTSLKRDATSTDINDYNAFVQSVAAGSTAFPLLGNGTWKVIGSTEAVSARVNTGTDDTTPGVGEPIFVLDGTTMIAVDNADLWNGMALRDPVGPVYYSPGYLNEEGVETSPGNHGVNCATGSNSSGTIRTPLGGSATTTTVNWGSTNPNNGHRWALRWDSGVLTADWSFYALSEPLFVGSPPDPLFWQAATSGNWAAPMWTTTPGTLENLVPTERTEMTIDQTDTVVTVNSAVVPARSVDVGASTNSHLVVADTFALEVTRAVDVGAAGTLTVNGGLTSGKLNSTGTVNIGAGAGLSTGSGSISSVVLAGDATIAVTDSTLDVASFTGSGGTLTKQGAGTLSAESITAGATTDFNVSQGTFEVAGSEPLGNKPVVLAGGKLRILSPDALVIDNPGFEDPGLADDDWSWSMDDQGWGYFGNDGYQGSWNVTTADFPGEAPEGENVGWAEGEGMFGGFAQVLTDPDATLKAGMIYTLSVEVGYALSTDPFGGYTVQLLAGGTPHTPGTGGDYTGPVSGGTLLAEDNNLLTIAQGTFQTSAVTYTYDPVHSDLLGEPLQIRLLAYAASDEVEFDNVYLTEVPSGTDPPNFSGIDLTVTEDSTLDIAIPLVDATFKSLTMQSGTLTTAGAASSIDFTTTTFADGSTASGFRTGVPTLLGTTTADGVTQLVVTKTGSRDLILDRAATGLGETTFDVQQGRLVAVETAAGGNPMDGAALQVGGGEIVLAGRTTGGAVTFDNQVNVTDDATLTAGPGDRGAPGPVEVTLGSAGSDTITLTSGTLVVQAVDNYTLTVAGNVVGPNGGINAPAGTVTLAQTVEVGSVDVTGGDLTAVMAPTADKMTVSDGQLTTAGATVGNFEISGGVVATSGNLDVTTGRVSGGSFSGLARGESNMVVSDSLNINNVTYSIDAGTFDANGTDLMSEADLTVSGGKLTLTGGVPVPENPQAYYSFDNSADPGHDDSDNAHHGTVTGASWTDAGIVGGALAFDGDDYVDCGSDASLDFPSAITMSAWGYSNSGSNGHIVNRGGGWGDPGYSMFWYGGNIRVELQRPGLKTTSDNPAPAVGEWHHILVTWDDTSDTITTYFNGVAQGNTGSFDGPIGTPNQNLNIGRNELQAYYFDGLIDEVFLYDRTLTEDEIVALYEGGVAGYYGEETVDQPTTNLLVTANTEIASDAPSVTLGNLTVTNPVDPPPTTLTLSDTFYSFNNVTVDDGVTIRGGFAVGGTLSPGSGVGTLNLDGELELIEGIYLCEIDSSGADLIHNANQDEGIILGEGQEGGTLVLEPLEGLGAPGCYTETILSTSGAGGIEGDFPVGQKPAEGDYLDYGLFLEGYQTVNTGAGFNYNLNLFQAGQGDTDGDGDVDLDDLSRLDDGWDPTAEDKIWTDGDVDGDGDVDLDDLSLLDDNWAPAGYPLVNCPFGGGGLGTAAVPEPGTLVLLAIGLLGLALWGRWRRAGRG